MRKFLPFVVAGVAAASFSTLALSVDIDANTKIKERTPASGVQKPTDATNATNEQGASPNQHAKDPMGTPAGTAADTKMETNADTNASAGASGSSGASTGAADDTHAKPKAKKAKKRKHRETDASSGASANTTNEAKKSDSQQKSPAQ